LFSFWQALMLKKIPFGFCANVHDEWQIETPPEHAEQVGQLGVNAIKAAGFYFKMRCPLDGEYRVGQTWKDTH
jgi:DNA polymerase I-like protein with 3'-5' exonuclease and polymerase domains